LVYVVCVDCDYEVVVGVVVLVLFGFGLLLFEDVGCGVFVDVELVYG